MKKGQSAPEIAPKEDLQNAFMRLHQKMTSAFRKNLKDMRFSLSQLEALCFIHEKGDPTMKELAAHLRVAAPSATAMIGELKEKGLVVRKLDEKDKRAARILPTPETAKFFSSLKEVKMRLFDEMTAKINDEEKKELVRILKKII